MARLSTCIDMCDHFRKHGRSYQRRHLQQRLSAATEKEDKEAEKQILAIIQQEKDSSFWRRINYVLGKRSSGPCFKVQVPQEDGGVVEHTSQDDLQNSWMKHHCVQEICVGCLGTTPYPALQDWFWPVPMNILLTSTMQQRNFLRNVLGFD